MSAPLVVRPYVPITADLVQRIDAALEKTQGHRAHAAILLDVDPKRLANVVYTTPVLKAKWGRAAPDVPEPGVASELFRDPAILPFTPEDLATVEASAQAEAEWSVGLARLNFTPEKREFLETVQAIHGNHWQKMAAMFQGGVSYTATELLFQFSKINATIQETYENPGKFDRTMENQWGTYVTKTAHEVRLELVDRALSIADMFRKLNVDSERATLIAAQVEKMKFEDAQAVKKRKKSKWDQPAKSAAPADAP